MADNISVLDAASATVVVKAQDNASVYTPYSNAVGPTASGSAVAANPVTTGGVAESTIPTAVADGQVVNSQHDIYGRQITIGAVRTNKGIQDTTITSSASETTIVTADATYKLDIYGLIVANKSATPAQVTIKDDTGGTTRAVLYVPAGDTRGFMLPVDSAVPQAAANKNWTATCTSVDSLYFSVFFVKNL